MNDEVRQGESVHRSSFIVHRFFSIIVISGILLRLAVFFTASPFNPDQHLEVIDFIVTQHRLPASLELGQAHHPPLYHLLVAPIWAATGSAKVLQFVSLLFSIANLLITAKLLKDLVASTLVRALALSFAAFLPQLVMYGSFVSNDSLTILLGTILFLRGVRYAENPNATNAMLLGVVCGLGLATKGTFLLAPLAVVVLVLSATSQVRLTSKLQTDRGRRHSERSEESAFGRQILRCAQDDAGRLQPGQSARPFRHLAIILSICIMLGGYKYAENLANYGRPFVHNLDPDSDWKRDQQGKWPSTIARWNLNLAHILREPILKVEHPASYPVLMYATLWYPHWPDSSYVASVNGYAWVGRYLYIAGLVPTMLLLVGVARGLLRRGPGIEVRTDGGEESSPQPSLCVQGEGVGALAAWWLLLNIALVMAVGAKFDVWSCFQARLCFASFTPGLLLFAWALHASRWRKVLTWLSVPAILGCVLYFVVEIGFVYELLPPGTPVTPN